MGDIIEQCAEAGNHTLNCPLSDKERDAFTSAVLAKFKELTAEPTDAMEEATGATGKTRMVILFGHRSMNAEMWRDIGI